MIDLYISPTGALLHKGFFYTIQAFNFWLLLDIVKSAGFDITKINANLQFSSINKRIYFHNKKYKIADGYTSSILTINNNGKTDINNFYTKHIETILKEISN